MTIQSTRMMSVFIIGLLALFLGLRTLGITADPPFITAGIGTAMDDTDWAHNARSKALTGEWMPDLMRSTITAPVTGGLDYLSFRLFGTGYAQSRLPNVVFSVLTALLIYLLIARQYGRPLGIVGMAMVGLCFSYLMHNRMSRPETVNTFFMVLNLLCWQRLVITRSSWTAFSVGLLCVFLPFCKINELYWIGVNGLFSIVFARMYVVQGDWKLLFPRIIVSALAGALVMAIVAAVWLAINWHDFVRIIGGNGQDVSAGVRKLVLTAHTLLFQNTFFIRMPVIVLLSSLGYVALYFETVVRRRELRADNIDWIAVFCGIWIPLQLITMSFFIAYPYRFVSLVPPMVILSTKGICWLLASDGNGAISALRSQRGTVMISAWLCPVGVVLSAQCLTVILGYQWFFSMTFPQFISTLVFAAAGGIIAASIGIWFRRKSVKYPMDWLLEQRSHFAAMLIAVSLTVNIAQYLYWASDRTYTQYQASEALRSLGNAKVFGGWAMHLSLENRIRPIPLNDRLWNPYEMAINDREGRYFLAGWSEVLGENSFSPKMAVVLKARNAKLVKEFIVGKYTVQLYEAGN